MTHGPATQQSFRDLEHSFLHTSKSCYFSDMFGQLLLFFCKGRTRLSICAMFITGFVFVKTSFTYESPRRFVHKQVKGAVTEVCSQFTKF